MLILAIAASGFSVGKSTLASSNAADEHACCVTRGPDGQSDDKDKNHHNDCGGACLMVCCRTVTAPADPVATSLDEPPVAIRFNLPPLHANDLGEPQSIFHPPRA